MLNRKIDNEIDAHFSNSKKALFLTGARQVGKTYSIRKYAKQHGLNLIEFNFLLQPEAMDIINGAEPLDSNVSDTVRIAYGNSSSEGRTGTNALSANAP